MAGGPPRRAGRGGPRGVARATWVGLVVVGVLAWRAMQKPVRVETRGVGRLGLGLLAGGASSPSVSEQEAMWREPDLRDYSWLDPLRESAGPASVPRQERLALCGGRTVLPVSRRWAIVTVSRASEEHAGGGAGVRGAEAAGGGRQHFEEYTGPRLRTYAEEVGADLHAVGRMCAEDVVLPRIAEDRGWSMEEVSRLGGEHRARLDKLVLFRFLEHYERVLWVDDSVYVHPLAPNVFDLVPPGMLGAAYERDGKTRGWQESHVARFCEAYAAGTCEGVATIFNSGVMVMDAGMRDTLLDPAQWFRIQNIGGLFDQGFFNGMTVRHGIQVFDLSNRWNFVGSQLRLSERRQQEVTGMVQTDACFAHYTRAIGPGKRLPALQAMTQAWYGRGDLRGLPGPPDRSSAKPGLAPCDRDMECGVAGCWTKGRAPVVPMSYEVKPIKSARAKALGPPNPDRVWDDPFSAPWPLAERSVINGKP